MSSRPLVFCFSYKSPPNPVTCTPLVLELSEHYRDHFVLVDQVELTDLSQTERENVKGILCTGGFTQSQIKVEKEMMDLLPNLKVISTPSTGVNHIDVEEATARGIRVGHSPGHFLSDSVADMAFGLLLASARLIVNADKIAKSSDAFLQSTVR